MLEVLLVYPTVFFAQPDSQPWVKTYLLALAASLPEEARCRVIDFEALLGRPRDAAAIAAFRSAVRDRLAQETFDILGISCWASRNYPATLAVAAVAREVRPGATIVVGGYHPAAVPTDFTSRPDLFDLVVIGEGEWALGQLAAGELRAEPGRVLEVNSRAHPDADPRPIDWVGCGCFTERVDDRYPHLVPLALSRGCPFACSFCMEPVQGRRWHPLPIEEAVRRVRDLVTALQPTQIGFADPCFGVHRGWRRAFLRRLRELELDTVYMLQCRPDLLEEEDLVLLAELPVSLELGVETLSPTMLEIMHKSRDPRGFLDRALALSRRASELGLVHRFNLLFNHPGETPATRQESLDGLAAHVERLPEEATFFWQAGSYEFYPGSAVHARLPWYEQTYGTRILHPRWWTEPADPEVLSRRLAPSRELGPEQLGEFQPALQELRERLVQRMHPELRELLGW